VELHWDNIKKYVLDSMSDLIGKVERRARKPWVTQEIIIKMENKESGRMTSTNTEGRTTEY
jgi:hypothetical protein